MRLLLSVQHLLIPMTLLFAAMTAYPAWNHFTLKETSPIFYSEAAVGRWAKAEAVSQKCIPWSVDLETESEIVGVRTPWFGTLRCNQHRIYTRLAIVFLGPWVVMNLVLLLIVKMIPPTKRLL